MASFLIHTFPDLQLTLLVSADSCPLPTPPLPNYKALKFYSLKERDKFLCIASSQLGETGFCFFLLFTINLMKIQGDTQSFRHLLCLKCSKYTFSCQVFFYAKNSVRNFQMTRQMWCVKWKIPLIFFFLRECPRV